MFHLRKNMIKYEKNIRKNTNDLLYLKKKQDNDSPGD